MMSLTACRVRTTDLTPSSGRDEAPFLVNCATKCQARDISNYPFALMKSTLPGAAPGSHGDLRQKAIRAAKRR
jgi:hypothetical protein